MRHEEQLKRRLSVICKAMGPKSGRTDTETKPGREQTSWCRPLKERVCRQYLLTLEDAPWRSTRP